MYNSKVWQPQQVKEQRTNVQHKQKDREKKSYRSNPKKVIRGDEWDRINLKEMLACKPKKLYQGQSKYQNIQILEGKEIRMFLDEQLQFSSLDERIYHEAFIHVPMTLTKSHERVLILGGGDGLALREVLKYSDVKSVDLVDIDPEIIYIARHIPEIVSLNEKAFFDKRVKAYSKDAREFLMTNKKTYDVIIVDFPDPSDAVLAKLYSLEMFQMLANFLEKDGVVVCQANSPLDTPTVFWSIGRTLETAGFHTEGYHTIVPSFGDWGFQLAAKKPFTPERKKVSVRCRTLPDNLASLFHFQSHILSYKPSAIVNTLDLPLLHEIFQKEIV